MKTFISAEAITDARTRRLELAMLQSKFKDQIMILQYLKSLTKENILASRLATQFRQQHLKSKNRSKLIIINNQTMC